MGHPVRTSYVSLAKYFEAELDSEERHEWINGVIYAISRGSPEHARVVAAINAQLYLAHSGRCAIYSESAMLFVQPASISTYADVTLVCAPVQTMIVTRNGKSLGEAIINPTVIVEVLSPSTERYDREEKFTYFKQLASLEEYVLVSQETRRIEVFRRPADSRGAWTCEEGGAGETVTIHGAAIAVDGVYAA